MIEVLIVLAIAAILGAIALPMMASQRRLLRFNGLSREFVTQLRYARQLAMSERQAITFQYDDNTKEINIIDHNNDTLSPTSGTAVLANAYPSTASPAQIVVKVSLLQGGLTVRNQVRSSHKFRIARRPSDDTYELVGRVAMTPLPSSQKFNITFQADGSVVNPSGVPTSGITLSGGVRMDSAIFIYDSLAPTATPTAISILGSSGRIKVWRYIDGSTNAFAE